MTVYISVDIESNGPIPGVYSMLSLGAAAYSLENNTPISTFEINISPLKDAIECPKTMEFWANNREAYEKITTGQVNPKIAMNMYLKWLKHLRSKLVFVGYPASFDFMFSHWYLIKFTNEDPMGFQALDLKTMAMCLLNKQFRHTTKRNMPKEWFIGSPKHDHTPLNDAIGQGTMFINMYKELITKFGNISMDKS